MWFGHTVKAAAGACALGALLLVAGCGDDGDESSERPRSSRPDGSSADKNPSSATPRTSYPSPHLFDLTSAVPLPDEAEGGRQVTLHGTTAYVWSPESLQAVDTGTGAVLARVTPEREAAFKVTDVLRRAPRPPAVSGTGADAEVIALFLVKIPGSGTTPADYGLEIIGVEAATSRPAWRTEIVLPAWSRDRYLTLSAEVAGVENGIAVVRASNDDNEMTYAVNLSTHKTLWQKELAPWAVTGGAVVGPNVPDPYTERHLTAFDISTGRPLWTSRKSSGAASAREAGPHLVQFTGGWGIGDRFVQLLDARTGKVRSTIDGSFAGMGCTYDGKAVIVCTGGGSPAYAFALDATSADLVWQLPDKATDRVAPSVTAVFNGAVYGKVTGSEGAGPVVLDSRTGLDIETSPGIAPVAVNGYVGIAPDSGSDTALAYRTTG
ncbi:outer membrane protein assembly factor BamB family protein [Streptomyces sp. NBC_01455]|uniref:outer membrane protein assembly factor BamB family protein n=1 Tax=Streptomyces sp. NBC_01455 TaxID=2903874 RepID=UPI002E333DC2|nr:PQQ-binding-like beta-propeller repeat protein [Streptomyces sp. NBC_01455]